MNGREVLLVTWLVKKKEEMKAATTKRMKKIKIVKIVILQAAASAFSINGGQKNRNQEKSLPG